MSSRAFPVRPVRNLKIIQMLRKPRSMSRRTATTNHATESQRTRLQAERILNFWLAPDQGAKDDVHLWKTMVRDRSGVR